MNWAVYPFLRLLLALSGGILLNILIESTIDSIGLLMLLSSLIFSIYFIISPFYKNIPKINIIGFLAIISFIWLGYLNAQIYNYSQYPQLDPLEARKITHYSATVVSKPAKTKKTFKYEVIVDKVKLNGNWINLSKRTLLYFISDVTPGFQYGDKLLMVGNLEYIKEQTNPYAFDYARYMKMKGIYLQGFSNFNDYIFIENSPAISLERYSLLTGDFLDQKLSALISSKPELDMIKAMLLGRREEISSEMEFVYQSTGTAHILAVSGLHVGIVFLLFSMIFRSLKREKWKWLYYTILLAGIWSFAFITGSSPSVLRASLMISIILFAEALSRKSNIYNSIFVSAFALLMYNPNLLLSVSFQLSYAAVLGIVFLYNRIYPLLYFKGSIANFFWKISALSLSVQITTFPITIYYFHQFPTVFLITNLIAIPTAIIVIVGSLLILLTSVLPGIPVGLAFLLENWIYFYNRFMTLLSNLTFTRIGDIYFKDYHVILLLCLVIFLTKLLETKRLIFMRYFTFSFLLLSGITFIDYIGKSNQKRVVFYDVAGKTYVDVFMGMYCYSSLDQNEEFNQDAVFNIIPNRKYHQIKETKSLKDFALARRIGENTFVKLGEITLLFLEDIESLSTNLEGLKIDYLVVNSESLKYLNLVTSNMHFSNLIIDGSVESSQALKVEDVLSKSHNVHSVSKDGALIISI